MKCDHEFLALARALGAPVAARRGDPEISSLIPLSQETARPRSLSRTFGLGDLPLHTDCAHHRTPPRYVLLRFAGEDGSAPVPTVLADSTELELSAQDRLHLRFALWTVNPGRRRFLSPVLSVLPDGHELLRFDMNCMRPAHESARLLGAWLGDQMKHLRTARFEWQPGSALVLDNWRMLHGRASIEGAGTSRVLRRIAVRAESS